MATTPLLPSPSPSQPTTRASTIANSYDQVAPSYLSWSLRLKAPTRESYLASVLESLPPNAHVLELGCGAGILGTQALLAHGCAVTGVDISAAQIALAREHVPAARLVQADMSKLAFAPGSFDGVVAFYSIFHLAPAEQAALVRQIGRWLRPGGVLVANFQAEAGERVFEDWLMPGVRMFSSGVGAERDAEVVREAGLRVVREEVAGEKVGAGEERFHWVLARNEGAVVVAGAREGEVDET